MKRLRVVIVDDERLARQKIRKLLEAERDVDVMGECASGGEALALLSRERPDLVFLDIQMPGLGGFDVLRRLGAAAAPRVIFVTAHDEFAVQAFEIEALDYLLKPFDAARLHQALERARRASGDDLHAKLGALLARLDAPARPLTRVLVRSAGRMSFVRVDEVDWIEAADNYLRLHVGHEEHLIRETLAGIESRLDPRRFVRIHRSAIVNLDRVTELRALFHGDHELLLKTGAALPVGRNYRERLMAALGG